jgi:hypothetical protein
VHHSSIRLDWLASARLHPLESVLTKLAAILPIFLLGFSPGITAFYGLFLGIYPIFIHSNLRWGYGKFGYFTASPAFHRWHHASDAEPEGCSRSSPARSVPRGRNKASPDCAVVTVTCLKRQARLQLSTPILEFDAEIRCESDNEPSRKALRIVSFGRHGLPLQRNKPLVISHFRNR